MRLFRKRVSSLSADQEKFARKIAGGILSAQRKAANYLNQSTANISPKTWLALLTGFCMVTGTYLIYLLAQVFN